MAIVVFDCDSTLVCVEGIDELARRRGCRDRVAGLTEASLAGEVSLREAIRIRFDLVRPGAAELEWLGGLYRSSLVAGAKDAISGLRAAGHEIGIVSGGPQQSVEILGDSLGIPAGRVRAFPIRISAAGAYAGFDEGSPLLEPDGKAVLCRELWPIGAGVVVGDAHTDAAAKEAGFGFIQFAGIRDRPSAAAAADARIAEADLSGVPGLVEEMLARPGAG